jgi:hypothetical protein
MKKRGFGFSSFIAKSTEIVKSFDGKTGGGRKDEDVSQGGRLRLIEPEAAHKWIS